MFKFLLIVGIVFYLIFKIGSWFFRAGAASQQFKNQRQGGAFNNNMNSEPQQKKKGTDFKGGEYIDYEEIK